MTDSLSKITLHMVSSLDGIIAKPDNSVSWFESTDHYEKGISEDGAAEFMKTIDCFVMGSRTYEHAEELSKSYGWAYGEAPTIVVTQRKLPIERKSIRTYAGDLSKLVHEELKPNYKNIWLVGGAVLARDFIRLNLVDEIRVSILPIILGNGTKLFDQIGQEHALHLKGPTAYKSGMVELWYEVQK
jgi:dihydrofolate reductase